jgi:hypothetical protein
MKKGLISLLVAVVVLAAGLAQMPQAAELKTFTITSGPLGGDFYALGGVSARRPVRSCLALP